MSHLLPASKYRVWQKVVSGLFALVFVGVVSFAWDHFRHKSWHWGSLIELAFVLLIASLLEGFDYYGWRNKVEPLDTINMDRDEGRRP